MNQTSLPLEPVVPVEQVMASLRRLRVQAVGLEYGLQAKIAERFDADGIPYIKEARLGPRNRIDFLCGAIGVECKKGQPNSTEVKAQIERYCGFDSVQTLILVVERHVYTHSRSAGGKPVHYISLAKLWGIAL